MVVLRHIVSFTNDFSQTLNALYTQTQSITSASLALANANVTAANALNQTAQAAGVSAASINNATRSLVTGAGAVAAIFDVAFGGAIKSTVNLEDAMARLETVTYSSTESVQTSLKKAESAARTFSTQWTASTEDVIKAQFELAEAGVPIKEQILGTQAAFKLARGGVEDFNEATKLLASVLLTFGKNAEFGFLDPATKIQKITDVLTTTVQRFQVTLPVLAEGLKFVLGQANQLDIGLSELTVTLGILNTAGFRGSIAGTALGNVLNRLQRATDKLDLDPKQFTTAEGEIKNLSSFFKELGSSLSDKSPLEGQIKLLEVFDIRAQRIIKTMIQSVDTLEKLSTELNVVRGSTDDLAKILERTTSSEFKKFQNTIQNIGTSIGKYFTESFRAFIRVVNDAISVIASIIDRFSGLFAVMAYVITVAVNLVSIIIIFKAVIFAVNAAVTIYIALVGALAAVSAIAAVAVSVLSIVLYSIAIIAVAAVIVGIVVALYKLFTASENASTSIGEFEKKLQKLRESGDGVQTQLQRISGEYQRIAEAAKLPSIDLDIVKSPIELNKTTRDLTELQRIISKNQASSLLNIDVSEVDSIFKSFERLQSVFDPTFAKLSQVEKFSQFFRMLAKGAQQATLTISGGNEQLAESFNVIFDAIGKVNNLDITPIGNQLRLEGGKEIFEALVQGIKNFQSSGSIVKQTKDEIESSLKALANSGKTIESFLDTSAGQENLKKLVNIFEEYQKKVQETTAIEGLAKASTDNFSNSLSRQVFAFEQISKSLDNYRKGGTDFNRFQKRSNELIADLNIELQLIPSRVAELESNLRKLKESTAGGSVEIKKLEEDLKKLRDTEDEIGGKLKSVEFQIDTASAFKLLTGITDKVSEEGKRSIEKLGNDFATTIKNAVIKGFSGGNIFEEISRQARIEFATAFSSSIGLAIAGPLKEQMQIITNEFNKSIELNPQFKKDPAAAALEFKKIFEQFATPELKSLTGGGDLFGNLEAQNKSLEDFASNLAKIQVGVLTSSATVSGTLRELQSIIQAAPIQSLGLDQLEARSTRLVQLLSSAPKGAGKFIEDELESVFKRINEIKLGKSGASQIDQAVNGLKTGAETIGGVVSISADRLRTALVDGGRLLGDSIGNAALALENVFKNANLANFTGSLTSPNQNKQVEIKIGERKLNVDVTVTGSGGSSSTVTLDDREVRDIISEVEKKLQLQLKEDIRYLEERLRNSLRR